MLAHPYSETLFWLAITLATYFFALWVYRKAHQSLLLHPLIITATLVFLILQLIDTSVTNYQQSAWLLDWLLGPATVALALPLYRQVAVIRRLGLRILIPILFGGVLAPLLAWLMVAIFSSDAALQMTMLVKSITTPFAIEVSLVSGGIPALAAGIVITTGIVGAIASTTVFKFMNIRSDVAKGIALGTVAHAIGTVKALQMNETTAALATLSLCTNGITTALIIPILF